MRNKKQSRLLSWLLNKFVLMTVIAATFLLVRCDVIERISSRLENMLNKSDVKTPAHPLEPEFIPPESETYDILGQCEGIENFVVCYGTELLRGGEVLNEHGLEILKQYDVKTVISVVPSEILEKMAKKYGMSYYEISFHQDSLTYFILNDFAKIIRENSGTFFIQCHDGTQRAGILCVYYRMKMDCWPFEKAALEFFFLGGKITESQKMFQVLQGAEKLEQGYESAQQTSF